jgi:hypothetical protein
MQLTTLLFFLVLAISVLSQAQSKTLHQELQRKARALQFSYGE